MGENGNQVAQCSILCMKLWLNHYNAKNKKFGNTSNLLIIWINFGFYAHKRKVLPGSNIQHASSYKTNINSLAECTKTARILHC